VNSEDELILEMGKVFLLRCPVLVPARQAKGGFMELAPSWRCPAGTARRPSSLPAV